MMKIQLLQTPVYHRNGISGKGFWALSIRWTEDHMPLQYAIATVDGEDVHDWVEGKSHDPATRILTIGAMGGIDIDNTMRGDHFHDDLCAYIATHQKLKVSRNKKKS